MVGRISTISSAVLVLVFGPPASADSVGEPTESPPSAKCAPDRQLWLIPSGPVVEKVPAKGERPGLKG